MLFSQCPNPVADATLPLGVTNEVWRQFHAGGDGEYYQEYLFIVSVTESVYGANKNKIFGSFGGTNWWLDGRILNQKENYIELNEKGRGIF